MFTLLTEPTSGKYRFQFLLKKYIKRLFFSRSYGPSSVVESILKGLAESPKIHFNLNPAEKNIASIVYVPVGRETLEYALDLKKKGEIQKLIVGPNISVPISGDDIFFNPLIDTILVPSDWVKDYFLSLVSDPRERIKVVPTGVDEYLPGKKNGPILIYKKDCSDHIFDRVKNALIEKDIEYTVIEYGKFYKDAYIALLDSARALIYLQTSESQGIALHEAWMKDVPTLVWNRGYWEYRGVRWDDPQIAAPYLTPESGMFFDETNFDSSFSLFLSRLGVFSPRKYSQKYFTNMITLQSLLQYIQ